MYFKLTVSGACLWILFLLICQTIFPVFSLLPKLVLYSSLFVSALNKDAQHSPAQRMMITSISQSVEEIERSCLMTYEWINTRRLKGKWQSLCVLVNPAFTIVCNWICLGGNIYYQGWLHTAALTGGQDTVFLVLLNSRKMPVFDTKKKSKIQCMYRASGSEINRTQHNWKVINVKFKFRAIVGFGILEFPVTSKFSILYD